MTTSFKMTKFHFRTPAEAVDLQKAMFTLGFMWANKRTGEVRKLANFLDDTGFIYVDEDCRLMQSGESYGFSSNTQKYAPAFASQLFVVAAEFKVAKGVERTASRKRAAMRREGWIANTGDSAKQPDGVTSVMLRDGSLQIGAWNWEIPFAGNADYTVEWYKLAVVPKATIVTQAEMVASIVADAGGRETVDIDSEGYIIWGGGDCPVLEGTLVDLKYREGSTFKPKFNVPALESGTNASWPYWRNDGMKNDIVAYRLSKQPDVFVAVPEVEPQPDTNPKRQYGLASIPLNLWSTLASAYGALGLYNGSLKYGKANFANTPVEASIYIAAAQRHLAAWAAGEEFDPADGVPNLGGVLANVAILLEARAAGMLIDDRLLMSGYLKERDTLKALMPRINEVHAGKTPKHYTITGK